MQRASATIGLISDTHGLVRPEALAALRGVDAIVHAGDIGALEVIEALRRIAPVHAVRGNVDGGAWARAFPDPNTFEVEGLRIHALHDLNGLGLDPVEAGVHVVVSGHSHRPKVHRSRGVLFVNPGSAGPRRFRLPVAVGRLRVAIGRAPEAEIVELAV